MPDVFADLQIESVGQQRIRTSSTTFDQPHVCPAYDVSISFVTGSTIRRFDRVRVIAGDFRPEEEVQGIIGRELLDRCILNYFGPDRRFVLSF